MIIFEMITEIFLDLSSWYSDKFLRRFFPKYKEDSKDQTLLSFTSGVTVFILMVSILMIFFFALSSYFL
jgi:hypothetical protein